MSQEWNFKKLPEDQYEIAKEAHKAQDIDTLVSLHDTYTLSTNNYCCSPDDEMMRWWNYGINNNFN